MVGEFIPDVGQSRFLVVPWFPYNWRRLNALNPCSDCRKLRGIQPVEITSAGRLKGCTGLGDLGDCD